MNDESRLMMRIWEQVSEVISSGDKQDAADAIVNSFVEFGYDVETLYDADGECPYIDRALATAAAEEAAEAEDDERDTRDDWENR